MSAKKIGLIVNPIAGVGGKVGLKGSDGVVEKALKMGSIPRAPEQTLKALKAVDGNLDKIFTVAGEMGENIARKAQIDYQIIYYPSSTETNGNDTEEAAKAMLDANVDLVVFAGGDGTARNITKVIGDKIPLVGIPAGVKMYSGVFANTPVHVGLLLSDYLKNTRMNFHKVEVLDINEDYLRLGRPETKLYGYATSFANKMIQVTKSSQKMDESKVLDATCYHVAKSFEKDIIHVIGPGSTMQNLKKHAADEGTLLGVDLIKNNEVIVRDATEKQILQSLKNSVGKIYIGVIGGTGCLFGRGNQQISADIIKKIGIENIMVISSTEKLIELGHEGFFVDTGEMEVDEHLKGYIHVQVGVNRQMMMLVQ